MIEFLSLPEERRRQFIRQVNIETGMSEKAVEKDWWVTLVLKAVFALPMSQHFVFKGGTSLSKGWKLVERLSEDIDKALAPEAFGKTYKGEPSHSYVKQLKKEGASFTSSVIANDLYAQLRGMGVPEELFSISVDMIRPTLPEKTMIEKLLLLHEKFSSQGVEELLIAERQSRHLADIVRLKREEIHHRILDNPSLFQAIIKHRQDYIRLKGVDYEKLTLHSLQFVPPPVTRQQFRNDYDLMRAQMIYGESPDFDTIINELQQLTEIFRTSAE